MIQDLGERVFCNHFEPHVPTEGSYVLHYRDGGVLVAGDGNLLTVPVLGDLAAEPAHLTYLFSIDAYDFFLARDEEVAAPSAFAYQPVHAMRHVPATWMLFALVTGHQLNNWYRDNRFCGTCGAPTELVPTSREICCPKCGRVIYPKISPAVIVGVVDRKANKIVLTRYANRPRVRHSLVAGFAEIGESLEQTVAREVMEEVGLRVRDLRFVGSQPWSFSDSLLVGFFCEVEGGKDIVVDHAELKEAAWFAPEEMPDRSHDHMSLTGLMMERFRARGSAVLDE